MQAVGAKKIITPYTIFFYICLAVVLYAGIQITEYY